VQDNKFKGSLRTENYLKPMVNCTEQLTTLQKLPLNVLATCLVMQTKSKTGLQSVPK